MSHPFPGLFGGRRKVGDAACESVDGSGSGSALSLGAGIEGTQNHGTKGKAGDGSAMDLITGKCMTCDSMVRWPRELQVFRCTVCLTINDLCPVVLEARKGDGARVVKSGTGVARASLLEVEKTREVIEKCVVEYLLGRLRHDGDRGRGKDRDTARSGSPEKTMKGMEVQKSSSISTDARSGIPTTVATVIQDDTELHPKGQDTGRNGAGGSETQVSTDTSKDGQTRPGRAEASRSIFDPLEDCIITSFGTLEYLNNSFSTSRTSTTLRRTTEGNSKNTILPPGEKHIQTGETLSELDAKTLLLGDVAENGLWWTGGRTDGGSPDRSRGAHSEASNEVSVTLKSPRIDWADVNEWYYLVLNAGRSWRRKLDELMATEPHQERTPLSYQEMDEIEAQIIEAQSRTQRVLLKATESLLKRPGRPLQEPNDLRFLLIILANPLLYPASSGARTSRSRSRSHERKVSQELKVDMSKDKNTSPLSTSAWPSSTGRGSSGRHSGIIKRILGLLSNVPNDCHHHLVSWFARYSDGQFQRTTDLIGSFVTYRLIRQNGQKREVDQDPTAGLIPSMSPSGRNTSAALHAALGSSSGQSKKNDSMPQAVVYNDDWQIRAAARVMALFFSANNSGLSRRGNTRALITPENGQSAGLAARERAHNHGQILPTSDFYNTLLDYSDLIADFEAWESKRGKFTFCQYPFFLSIWAKIQIMEHDARRQMEVKAREAFFDSIMTHKNVNQYLVLKIRRDCLVEDSLKGVSEVVGSGDEEIKKGLRIEFKGEEGIDAGGLRKEWFLLLVRDVFNPEHGMYKFRSNARICLIADRNVHI